MSVLASESEAEVGLDLLCQLSLAPGSSSRSLSLTNPSLQEKKNMKCQVWTLNVLLSDLCRNGFNFLALKTLSFMHSSSVPIDTYALCSSLTAASSIQDVSFGREIHSHVIKSGWCSSVFVGSALIDLYAKSLLVEDAYQLFDEMPLRNTVCANALLSGYGDAKLWAEGVDLIRKMPALSLEYDRFTLSAALCTSAGLAAVELGRQVHGYLIRSVYDVGSDVFLLSSLIEMYGKCGMVVKAWRVFNFVGKEREREMWLCGLHCLVCMVGMDTIKR